MSTREVLISTVCLACAVPVPAQRDRISTGEPASVQVDSERLRSAAALYESAVERDLLRGAVIMVVRKGCVVLHEAYGWRDAAQTKAMQRDSLFRMASNTKPVTAAAVLSLVDDGEVELDQPVHEFFPTFERADGEQITVRHLLTHTSGLRIPTLFVRPLMKKSDANPDAPNLLLEVARFGEIGPRVEPGTSYSYSNPGFNTLAGLVEKVSGKPFKQFLRERFYEPLGMRDSCNHEPDADHDRMSAVFRKGKDGEWRVGWKPGDGPDVPFPRGSGGMISTAHDYAVFCQMLLNGGTYGGNRLLSKALVAQATRAQEESIAAAKRYGLGWVTPADGSFSHNGSDGTWAWVDPERELIGIVFTQSPGAGRDNPRARFRELVNSACE